MHEHLSTLACHLLLATRPIFKDSTEPPFSCLNRAHLESSVDLHSLSISVCYVVIIKAKWYFQELEIYH